MEDKPEQRSFILDKVETDLSLKSEPKYVTPKEFTTHLSWQTGISEISKGQKKKLKPLKGQILTIE